MPVGWPRSKPTADWIAQQRQRALNTLEGLAGSVAVPARP